jgi:hypothetical protein
MSEPATRPPPGRDSFVALVLGLSLLAIGGYLAIAPWSSAGEPGAGVIAARLLMSAPFALLAAYGASLALRYLAPGWVAGFGERFWWLRGVAALGLGVPIVLGAAIEALIKRDVRVIAGPMIFAVLAVAGALDLRRQRQRRPRSRQK